MFPKAVYTSNKFVKTGDKTFTAEGTLTIRDKSQPVTLTFTQEEYSATRGRVKGSTTLKRLLFGVGQGEWADTKTISDDVLVDFVITATKK
jgi:polyisoprenoid-binding protein YceI